MGGLGWGPDHSPIDGPFMTFSSWTLCLSPGEWAPFVVLQGRCDTFITVPASGGAHVHTDAIPLVGGLSQLLRVLRGGRRPQRISFQSHLARQPQTMGFWGLD